MKLLIVLPCCIGDVVLATACLQALRRAYPQAEIHWAVGDWSARAIEYQPNLNALLHTGKAPLPVKSWAGFWQFVRQVRAGKYNIVVSLVRSPLMSLALLLTGIPTRAGLDSNGRGFGYTHKAPLNPDDIRHEALIYLSAVQALGINTENCTANIPVRAEDSAFVRAMLSTYDLTGRYLVVHPGGGNNPGMVMDSKRYPPAHMAQLADKLSTHYRAQVVLIGAETDTPIIRQVQRHSHTNSIALIGQLSFLQIAALAKDALCYIGNDSGLTHLAAASGAMTFMIMGPTQPQRYAPFTAHSKAIWKPVQVQQRGVSAGEDTSWDWSRDGIDVSSAFDAIVTFLNEQGVQ
jgi:heptosyltransferase II